MHELSIANSILDIVREHVPPEQLSSVKSVKLKVGDQAGVVVDSLEFSFMALTADSPLRSARLDIEHVPFRIACNSCHVTSSSAGGFALCPQCGSGETEILSGMELRVVEIELLEPALEGS